MHNLTPIQIRLFIGSFIAVFTLVAIQFFGLSLNDFISPVPKDIDVMEIIKPKLSEKENSFSLTRKKHFIPQASAGESNAYDEASSYIVMDFETGEIIAEKNAADRNSIASITKVMSSIVALDLVEKEDVFTVSNFASTIEPTKIGVIPGQKMTVLELLEATLMTSANDATEVLREGVDATYKENVFIRSMNEKAKIIGLKNTHFQNPQGFDGRQHFSTSEDLAILCRYALTEYPLIAQIVKNDYQFLKESQNHKQFDLYNWNGLIGVYPNVMGVKIGNTDDAGRTTVVVAEREGKKILVVLLGAPGILERDMWAAELLDLGFKSTLGLEGIKVTEEELYEKYATWQYGKS